jgi:hypothetical protein
VCRVEEIDGTTQDVPKAVVGEAISISYYEAISVVFVPDIHFPKKQSK